jgi:hypothetical protein
VTRPEARELARETARRHRNENRCLCRKRKRGTFRRMNRVQPTFGTLESDPTRDEVAWFAGLN